VNKFKILVLSTLFATFTIFSALAQENAPTPEQIKKVLTQICGDTVTSECLNTFLENKNSKKRMALSGYELARDILGDDFITPYEVTKTLLQYHLFYSTRGKLFNSYPVEQLTAFQGTLPSKKILRWLKLNNYILVAGPPTKLSLFYIHRTLSKLFSLKSPWYTKVGERFSFTDTVGPVWLAIRKGMVPNSIGKRWSEQRVLLRSDERVPNVAEAVWGLLVYKEVRGVSLVKNSWIRVSSVHSLGDRVNIGNGMRIARWEDNTRGINLGLSSALKFQILNP